MTAVEVNYDGLVGPTHFYGGLVRGNVASTRHGGERSRPREAALEGLAKMRSIHALGVPQAVIPPHDRPAVHVLRSLGFAGNDATVLENAYREDPSLLAACASGSAMWTANAATISPAADTADGQTHISPANLIHAFHRSIESPTTSRLLHALLPAAAGFIHHPPLPAQSRFADEGAANHMRLTPSHEQPGLELFIYGRAWDDGRDRLPKRYPARQARDASAAIARRHNLPPQNVLLLRQHPDAIDAGAFHNDVVAVSNENVLLYHELAFAGGQADASRIAHAYERLTGKQPVLLTIRQDELPIESAVETYLFNSQLVRAPDATNAGMVLIAPAECEQDPRVRQCIERLIAHTDNPITDVRYVNLRQSMWNGGGPACLRLRVVMNKAELARVPQGVMFTPQLHDKLRDWVQRHYRQELAAPDLADPKLLHESRDALDELTRLLHLGTLYDFQQ